MSIDMASLCLGLIAAAMGFIAIFLKLEKRRALKRLEEARAFRESLERSAADLAPYIKGATHDRS